MTLDPEMKAILEQIAAAKPPPLSSLSPAEARAAFNRLRSFFTRGEVEAVARCADREVPGPAGRIPIRAYTPRGGSPCGAMMFFHGGGWVLGDLDSHDNVCRALANAASAVIISVDYRLAPEHKFPAAPEDCYAAAKWCADNAKMLGFPTGHLAVGGDSAGGNLAAVVALMARDRGGPSLRYQMIIYPAFDPTLAAASQKEFDQEGFVLSRADMDWFWKHYLASPEDGRNVYADPMQAKDLSKLPPALVVIAGFDPLRDEGLAYADKLTDAGVNTVLRRYNGLTHGFFNMGTLIREAGRAVTQAGESLRTALTN
ncbi:MAG: alpha/beta hydrolase [Candidatus Binataceae bacterium]